MYATPAQLKRYAHAFREVEVDHPEILQDLNFPLNLDENAVSEILGKMLRVLCTRDSNSGGGHIQLPRGTTNI